MFYAYVLKCKDGTFYTGYTDSVERRLQMHNAGKASKYTRSRLPVTLVCKWEFDTKSKAMSFEAKFKTLTRKEKSIIMKKSN